MTKNENNARLKILSSRILAFQTVKFITVRCGEIPYVGGLLGPRKVNVTCHYVQLSKIQGMKSISKPRLPIEIYTFREIISTEEEEVLIQLESFYLAKFWHSKKKGEGQKTPLFS